MENDKFIHKNIKDYILYVSDVKNLSKNTSLSYERDLKKCRPKQASKYRD